MIKMSLGTCGWGVILFAFFLFLAFIIKEREWYRALMNYLAVSIPVVQVLAFLANPPHVSAVPVLFILWLIILVFPTSRDYWVYTRRKGIPMYEAMDGMSLWRKDIPLPILIIVGGGLTLEGAWFLSERWGLVILWLWGVAYFFAVLNRKLEKFAIFVLEFLPLISVTVYVIQCRSAPSIVYGGSILLAWIFIAKGRVFYGGIKRGDGKL